MHALDKPAVKTNTQKFEQKFSTINKVINNIKQIVATLPPHDQLAVRQFKHQVNGHPIVCTIPGGKLTKSIIVLNELVEEG